MSEPRSPQRYRFGPLERRGLIAGWRGGQIAAIAVGLLLAVVVLRAAPSMSGAVGALGLVGLSVAAATWPLRGRTVEEWAPDAIRYAHGRSRQARASRTDPFSTLCLIPVEVEGDRSRARTGDAAVVADVARRTYCVTFRARAWGFVLLGEDEKASRVASWAGVLASLAREGSIVHRVQWVCRSLPARAQRSFVPEVSSPAVNGRAASNGAGPLSAHVTSGESRLARHEFWSTARAEDSYAALLEERDRRHNDQEVLLSVAVRPTRMARSARQRARDSSGCTLAVREASVLRRRLADVGVDTGRLLAARELQEVLRRAFEATSPERLLNTDDFSTSEDRSGFERRGGRAGAEQSWPWPMATRAEWARAQIDGTWHCTYWVAEWPRTEVGPDFLGPLLLPSDLQVSVSLVMEPMGPIEAARKLEQARTADIADSELRRRGGFLATARRRREQEVLAERELELADGHAPFRYSGYVSVRAEEPKSLEDACARIEQAAARCGLELRLCYGNQLHAFVATLPLCTGLS